jgi:hypothetical protein
MCDVLSSIYAPSAYNVNLPWTHWQSLRGWTSLGVLVELMSDRGCVGWVRYLPSANRTATHSANPLDLKLKVKDPSKSSRRVLRAHQISRFWGGFSGVGSHSGVKPELVSFSNSSTRGKALAFRRRKLPPLLTLWFSFYQHLPVRLV